ncbi:MAG: phosphogluconate dehydrogenase (NAD(+)-dependent, decarboxylating) [Planctomycetota bacterium]
MKIGFIGLGKMGANMVERLLQHGHEVVAFNKTLDKVEEAVQKGAQGASSRKDLVRQLPTPKVVWIMVPSGAPVDENIDELLGLVGKGDILIDGGNSNWRDTQKRAARILAKGVQLIDCGTSGGVWGLKNGYCLMYGGEKKACEHVEPVFKALAPENGYIRCGDHGAGHFVKMVHNGIEYGMMQAYAEGFEIMKKSPFDLDLRAVSQAWQHGSVVRSWLLELAESALSQDPGLDNLEAFVSDSGEGRWTVQAAIDFDVPAPVITQALFARFQSRDKDSFAMRMLAALRNQFGGHAVKPK